MVTMATSTLDTELTCSICLEFYREPYLLPCMHSFCKQCLVELSKPKITSEDDDGGCSKGAAKPRTDKDENVLECPECRHIVTLDDKGIDGLPKNFTLANIVKKYAKQEEKEEKKYPCDICDTEPPRDAVKCCLQCRLQYCDRCLSLAHPSKGKLKTHKMVEPSECQFSETVSEEDSKIIDGLLKSVSNLEVLKRKVERNVRETQTNIDDLHATGGRRKKETRVVFDRLCTMLRTKEHRFISELDKDMDEKTDVLLVQLSSWQQFAEDINKVIKDAKFAVDDFPRKTTRTVLQTIQTRISDIEKRKVNFDQQNLAPARDLANTVDIENKIEGLGYDTGKQKSSHIWDISVQLIPTRSGASISVAWTKLPGKDMYNVSVDCTSQNGIKERTIFSCIQGSRHKIENLRPDIAYQIYVAVHGEPDTESHGVNIQTLKCVPYNYTLHTAPSEPLCKCEKEGYELTRECHPRNRRFLSRGQTNHLQINCASTTFRMNGKCTGEETFVSEDSKIMMSKYVSDTGSKKYSRLVGTTGTIEISSGSQYWETKCLFSFAKGMCIRDYVLDLGICYESKIDRIEWLYKNFNAYSVNVVKRGTKDIRIEFNKEGNDVNYVSETLEWDDKMMLHFGFYLNIDKSLFSVINVKENRVIYTFENIKTNAAYLPVFSHSNSQCKPYLEIQLLSGLDILEIPSCLLDIIND